jgi:hypothetical protein
VLFRSIGGTLNRNYYEQFTVTAATGSQIRVDSITFVSDFYNTISGIKMGVVYSKNGFTSPADSTEFSSGVGPGGVNLTLATSGSFNKSFTVQRNDAGPINKYAISLNGVDGVTLNPGETITIRLYWACGSTGTPRFAFLKDVIAKGVVLNPVPLKLTSFEVQQKKDRNNLKWTTINEQDLKQIEVQKSKDQFNYETIATKAPQLSTTNNYSFADMQPLPLQYYRLKCIDWNGGYFYSPVKVVKNNFNALRLYPNPVVDQLSIEHDAASSNSKISIYGIAGNLILTAPVSVGTKETTLSLSTLQSGTYFAVYFDGQASHSNKFVKK